jgi:signal transduction histidine kinase
VANGDGTAPTPLPTDGDEALRVRDAFIQDLGQSILTPVAPVYLQLRSIVRHATESPEVIQDPGWLLPRLADLSERFEEYLRRIDHVCDLAQAISGQQPAPPEWLDLASVIHAAAAHLERDLTAAEIDLTIDDGPSPVTGLWERARLEGLCSHLLTSSIKFGTGTPVTMSIRNDGGHATLTVTARRQAVPEVDSERVLDELGKREAAAGSLSVGLWAVRHLARAMGGTLAVTCHGALGATFTVTLPSHDA